MSDIGKIVDERFRKGHEQNREDVGGDSGQGLTEKQSTVKRERGEI